MLVASAWAATGCTLLYDTGDLRPGPYIDHLSPERALYLPDGTVSIEIHGSNFGDNPRVYFAWEEIEPSSVSSNLIHVELPSNHAFGAMDVSVETGTGSWTASPGFFLYSEQVGVAETSSASIANTTSWDGHADGFIADMATGDFIGRDQVPDLAVVIEGTGIGMPGGFLVLPGRGDGTFDAQNVGGGSTAGDESDDRERNRAVTVGDFNGDDHLDAVVAQACCTGNSAFVFYGDSDGGFDVVPVVAAGGDDGNRGTVAVGTLERNNREAFALYRSDVPNMEGYDVLEVFVDDPNDGLISTSRFAPNPEGAGPAGGEAFVFGGSVGNVIATADFDNDGNFDVIAPVSRTPMSLPVEVGDMGTPVHGVAVFTAETSTTDLAARDPEIERLEGFDTEGGGWSAMVATDVNFDYRPDVVGMRSNKPAEAWTLVGQEWGWFEYTPIKTELAHDASDIAVADVNGDGLADLWTCQSGPSSPSAHAYLYLGRDSGGFDTVPAVDLTLEHDTDLGTPYLAGMGLTTYCGDLVAGDFDGDGLPDLAIGVAQRNENKTVGMASDVEEWAFSVRIYLNTSDEQP